MFGLFRESIFAHFFGSSFAADAFRAALRIPNVLQNLFGEGVLSASFIPVYAKLTAEGDRDEAGRVAGAVFSLLAVVTSILVVVGVLATPYLIEAIAPGFHGERRRLAIQLVDSFAGGVEQAQNGEQRGFSAAGRAGDGDILSTSDLEVNL